MRQKPKRKAIDLINIYSFYPLAGSMGRLYLTYKVLNGIAESVPHLQTSGLLPMLGAA